MLQPLDENVTIQKEIMLDEYIILLSWFRDNGEKNLWVTCETLRQASKSSYLVRLTVIPELAAENEDAFLDIRRILGFMPRVQIPVGYRCKECGRQVKEIPQTCDSCFEKNTFMPEYEYRKRKLTE